MTAGATPPAGKPQGADAAAAGQPGETQAIPTTQSPQYATSGYSETPATQAIPTPHQASAVPLPDAPDAQPHTAAHPTYTAGPGTHQYTTAPLQSAHQPAALAPQQPQQTPPKRGSGFGRGFGLGTGFVLGGGLALTLLHIPLLIGILIIGLLAGSPGADTATGRYPTTLYGEDSAKKTVVALNVSGMILASDDGADIFSTGTYGYQLADHIGELDATNSDGLLLIMETPGGTINGSKAISDAVSDYRERTGNKVYAYVQSLSASGGMMAMAGADEIIVDHGSFVGSIGVIMGPYAQYTDVTGIDGGLLGGGVDAGSITQRNITAGKGKDFGDPFRPNTPEDYEHYQRQITTEYDHFVNHVATHRDLKPAYIRDTLGAYLYTTDEAIRVGLADSKMSRPEAFQYITQAVGGDGPPARIASGTERGLWAEMLSASTFPWTPKANSPWTDGVEPTTANPLSRAEICTNPTLPLAVHGSLAGACGTAGS